MVRDFISSSEYGQAADGGGDATSSDAADGGGLVSVGGGVAVGGGDTASASAASSSSAASGAAKVFVVKEYGLVSARAAARDGTALLATQDDAWSRGCRRRRRSTE